MFKDQLNGSEYYIEKKYYQNMNNFLSIPFFTQVENIET